MNQEIALGGVQATILENSERSEGLQENKNNWIFKKDFGVKSFSN